MADLAVGIAILEQDKVLLIQREDFEIWCLPGGIVDEGESLAEAALREVGEETGLEVELRRLVGTYSLPRWRQSTHVVLFTAVRTGGELRRQRKEVLDIKYFAADQLPHPLMIGQRQRILDAVGGLSGVARSLPAQWPLAQGMSREELYALRDRSGLPRQQFYLQEIMRGVDEREVVEVPSDQHSQRTGNA